MRNIILKLDVQCLFAVVGCVLSSSEPYYQATTETRLGEENKGHQLLTKMGESTYSCM